jgi:hypothetical protein
MFITEPEYLKQKRKDLKHGDFIRDKNGKFTMVKKESLLDSLLDWLKKQ